MPRHSDVTSGSTRLILVGERGNYQNLTGKKASWKSLFAIGAFTQGPARKKLESLGLEWIGSINLLSPLPTGQATWTAEDKEEAKEKAWETLLHARLTGCSLVVCGSRAAESFGVKFIPLSIHSVEGVIIYIMPHPSGRNIWWNKNTEAARDFVLNSIMKDPHEPSHESFTCATPLLGVSPLV